MDDKKEEKQAAKTTSWGTRDRDLQEEIKKAKIPPKKFDPTEIKK
jgi:hypothetical protein